MIIILGLIFLIFSITLINFINLNILIITSNIPIALNSEIETRFDSFCLHQFSTYSKYSDISIFFNDLINSEARKSPEASVAKITIFISKYQIKKSYVCYNSQLFFAFL